MAQALDALPIAGLKGVGARTLPKLEKLGLRSIQDLLFHLPLRYEDRTTVVPIGGLRGETSALIEGVVELTEIAGTGRRSLVCRISDGTGFLNLRFFHFTAEQRARLAPGLRLRCFGEVREGYYGLEMSHPDYQPIALGEAGRAESGLTPVYPLTEGIHQKALRRLIDQALSYCEAQGSGLAELIPEPVLSALEFPPLAEALRLLHRPPPGAVGGPLKAARRRLAFEELLAHHLSMSRFRGQMRRHEAPVLALPEEVEGRFLDSLAFALTAAQLRVIRELGSDLAAGRPMLRLVQGDVGSGKTVVAAHAALAAVSTGYQVAVMAPTELLAEQHWRNFSQWLEPLGVPIGFLGGRQKGAARREVLGSVAEGRVSVVIGTQALFQDQVEFQKLALVIIDEQHRFGVHQRLALREKGREAGVFPHQLVMTATPIPRTLAMLGYADLDVSVIDELPPGRTPVTTAVLPAARRGDVIARIAQWIAAGRQAYWVCTLIEESEFLQSEAAEKTFTALSEALPQVRVALMHGRLKTAEKDAIMAAFKAREVDLLVATTVIEVGVDVPNASLMVIENAERLGLAQLHQLRGRVGRGRDASHCLLMYQGPLSRTAKSRLGILRDSSDGFVIAEKDLELRGPGELLGLRQTGQVQFRIADLERDRELLETVPDAAELVLRDHPDRVDPLLKRWIATGVQYADV